MPDTEVIGTNGPRPKMKGGRNRNTVRNKASKNPSRYKQLMGGRSTGMGGLDQIRADFTKSVRNARPTTGEAPQRQAMTPMQPRNMAAIMPQSQGDTRIQSLATLAQVVPPALMARMLARGEPLAGLPDELGGLIDPNRR